MTKPSPLGHRIGVTRPRGTMTTPRPEAHAHGWRDAATVREHKVDHSPVSHGDCSVYDQVVVTQSCPCGEFRRVVVGYENEKRGCW